MQIQIYHDPTIILIADPDLSSANTNINSDPNVPVQSAPVRHKAVQVWEQNSVRRSDLKDLRQSALIVLIKLLRCFAQIAKIGLIVAVMLYQV